MTATGTLRNTSIDTLGDVLTQLAQEGAALGHFNVADHVWLKAVIAAAAETKLPVLVGASEGEREFFVARQLAALVKSLRQESDVPVFLNADHTHSLAKPWKRRMRDLMPWELIFPRCPSKRIWLAPRKRFKPSRQ